MADAILDLTPQVRKLSDRYRDKMLETLRRDTPVFVRGEWIEHINTREFSIEDLKKKMEEHHAPAQGEVWQAFKFKVYEDDSLTFKILQEFDSDVLKNSFFLVFDAHLDIDRSRSRIDLGTFRGQLFENGLVNTPQMVIVSRDSIANYPTATKFEGNSTKVFSFGEYSVFGIDLDTFYSNDEEKQKTSNDFVRFVEDKKRDANAKGGVFFVMVDVDVAAEDMQPDEFAKSKVANNPVVKKLIKDNDQMTICLSLDFNKKRPDLPFDEVTDWINQNLKP